MRDHAIAAINLVPRWGSQRVKSSLRSGFSTNNNLWRAEIKIGLFCTTNDRLDEAHLSRFASFLLLRWGYVLSARCSNMLATRIF